MELFYNLLNSVKLNPKVGLLFDFALKTIKANYLMILFFILLAIVLTIMVNKMNYFNAVTKRNLKPKSKRLVLFGIWLIPFSAFLVPFRVYLLDWIGGAPIYIGLTKVLKILPLICMAVILFFIVFGIYAVSAERKKEYQPIAEKPKNIKSSKEENKNENDEITLF